MLYALYLIYLACNGWLAAKYSLRAYRKRKQPIAVAFIYLLWALFGSILYTTAWLYGFICGLLILFKTRK